MHFEKYYFTEICHFGPWDIWITDEFYAGITYKPTSAQIYANQYKSRAAAIKGIKRALVRNFICNPFS